MWGPGNVRIDITGYHSIRELDSPAVPASS